MGRRIGERGISLVEILVSLVVLAIAATGLFRVASTATLKNTAGRDQVAAMQLATEKLEELRNTPFEDLASGAEASPIEAGGGAGGIYDRSWSATSRTVAGVPAKDVAVTVTWTGGGAVTLTTTLVQPSTIVPGLFDAFPTVAIRSWDHR